MPGDSSAARMQSGIKVYGQNHTEVWALDSVSVQFERGKFTAIMGPSGSGKSTLLHCTAGLDNLTSGQVWIGKTELGSLNDKDLTLLRREQVGFIFQTFNLIPTLTAKENIILPISIARKNPDLEWFEKVVETIGLKDRLHHRPSELSGGQQQRVAAARALVSKPQIIFADEPSGNLDSHSGAELLDFLRRAVDEFGQTIVMVTHDSSAASRADKIMFLDDGRLVGEMPDPTIEDVLDRLKQYGN